MAAAIFRGVVLLPAVDSRQEAEGAELQHRLAGNGKLEQANGRLLQANGKLVRTNGRLLQANGNKAQARLKPSGSKVQARLRLNVNRAQAKPKPADSKVPPRLKPSVNKAQPWPRLIGSPPTTVAVVAATIVTIGTVVRQQPVSLPEQ